MEIWTFFQVILAKHSLISCGAGVNFLCVRAFRHAITLSLGARANRILAIEFDNCRVWSEPKMLRYCEITA